MNLFSVQFYHVIFLSLAITLPTTSLSLAHEPLAPKIYDTKATNFLDSFFEGLSELEIGLSNASNNVVEYFQEMFHAPSHTTPKYKYDVTLVGFVNFADGIGRHPILFKECIGDNAKINFLSTRDISPDIEDLQLGLPRLRPGHPEDIGAISILTDILADKALNLYTKVPNSLIKVAYTMFESTRIPDNWVHILNHKFDMAVVPDHFLVNVFKHCGVKIPVFVLPLPLLLQDFMKIRQRPVARKPFVFGTSGGFWKRKNHIKVLEAFIAEFGNRSDVQLKLHGRFGEESVIKEIVEKIKKYNLTNVELIVKPFNWEEYLAFFKSLDCYVFLSMGEGFSITPREALAAGKPCILTNNTAQTTICNTGTVRVVPSNIPVPAFYDCHYDNNCLQDSDESQIENFLELGQHGFLDHLNRDDYLLMKSANIGFQFDCSTHDAREAMRDVYENYSFYNLKAKEGREWVKQYLYKNLSSKYVSLVKPRSIVLGQENIIGDNFLMTDSKALYEKYRELLGMHNN